MGIFKSKVVRSYGADRGYVNPKSGTAKSMQTKSNMTGFGSRGKQSKKRGR